jgi:type I restriction-modification system DNA methylase subunit
MRMSQLTFTFDAPEPAAELVPAPIETAMQRPLLLASKVEVPADPTDSPESVRRLFRIIDQMFNCSRDHDVFRKFLRVVDALLRRFESAGEADYMLAIKSLEPKTIDLCCQAFAVMVDHFWHEGCYADLLGPVYMEIRCNWKGSALGQFFTPWNLCLMMAKMNFDDDLAQRIERGERVSVCDPACGSGATLLATRAAAAERFGRKTADRIVLAGQDIDELCVLMAKIQLRMSHGNWMSNFMIASYTELDMRQAA